MDLEKLFFDENEKPLDRISEDGGFTGIFRKIACVGDSLSSGEFEVRREGKPTVYLDMFDYSWGQYIARIAGCKVYNFSRGGMTAQEYCDSFAEAMGYWDPEKAAQAYVIALGVNDIFGLGQEIGSVGDICRDDPKKNKNTVVGRYAEIIQRYKKISADAKFFLVTMPRDGMFNDKREAHRNALYELAKFFDNCYVIDLYEYMPVEDAKYKERFYLEGHLNPCGYLLTGKIIASYIDYIIRHNINDFRRVPFINTEYSDSNLKKGE